MTTLTSSTEEQTLLLDAIQKFARAELLDADRRWDEDESSMAELLPAVADMGLMSLTLPESAGGLDCTMKLYADIIRELAYASPSMAVTLSVHSMVVKICRKFAPDAWKTEWLEKLASAENLTAFAISEADAGSDPSSAKTTATKSDNAYRITGSKMWITNGESARWFIVLARTDQNQPGSAGLSAFLVDGQSEGVEHDKIRGKMGIRGSETVVLHLSNVLVPAENLMSGEGDGLKVCLAALDEGRVGIAAQAAGIAQACVDEMTEYAKQRVQFGQPIAEFQSIQNMIADSAVELEAARLLIQRAATLIDEDRKSSRACAMAKLYASEAANRIAYRAVQVHGGSGFVKECRVEQLYRDARVTTIYEGTSEIQRHVIAREILNSGLES